MKQYQHETLATVHLWITPSGRKQWMLYCGPCEKCGRGTLWMWTAGQVMMGVAQCDKCNGSGCWNIDIESADWVSWALEAIKGRWGQQQTTHGWPPPMIHHMIIP